VRHGRAILLDRHQEAVCLDKFVEDLLQNVFRVERVGHAASNEVAQARLVPLDHIGDPLVLFEAHLPGHWRDARRVLHLQIQTNEGVGIL